MKVKIEIQCKMCNKKFKVLPCRVAGKKYCSMHCLSKSFVKERIIRNCLKCNKDIEDFVDGNRKFCSVKCSNVYNKDLMDQTGSKNHRWNPDREYIKKSSKVLGLMKTLIQRTVKNTGGKTLEEILGYTKEDLINHLEFQFKEDMTWDNHGRSGWHMDHIISIKRYNAQGVKDPKIINALDNLQPIWVKDHHVKRRVDNYLLKVIDKINEKGIVL